MKVGALAAHCMEVLNYRIDLTFPLENFSSDMTIL